MLIIDRKTVEQVLDMAELIDRLGPAMGALSAGEVSMAPRNVVSIPEHDAILGGMPAYAPAIGTLSAKLVTVFPGNASKGLDSHHAVIVVFDAEDGQPAALMDGGYVTAARTAAGSALATRLLANEDASVLAILGTGVQARFHALALRHVRGFSEIRIAGRDGDKAKALAASLSGEIDMPVRAAASFEEATRDADVVCLTTHAREPVVRRDWLKAGAHVTSVGVNPHGPETDAQTVIDARVYVETREAALAPAPSGANDLLWPIRDGLITADHIKGEIGELVAGTARGRTSPMDLTFYKSVGVALQDAVAANMVLEAVKERSLGQHIAIY